MHPFLRNVVIGVVGLLIAGGLAAIAVLTSDPSLETLALLVAGLLGTVVGFFLFVQGWIWSQRAWRRGFIGRSVAIAAAGGLMILVAAGSLGGTILVVLLFYLA
jgi:hypothetical protein